LTKPLAGRSSERERVGKFMKRYRKPTLVKAEKLSDVTAVVGSAEERQ
jgi:hypothetical protein